ncbi:MAG TPA: copper transporter, partial [Actinomycetota bacterium]
MISFRFHLVSLVAVFLALGLGVLTGTTVLNRGIVAQLERTTDRLSEQSGQLREEVARLEARLGEWGDFGAEIQAYVVTGRLAEEEIVLVTQEGTDPAAVDAARQALELAGASVRLDLTVRLRMALTDTGDRDTIARVLEADAEDDPGALRDRAAETIADQVAFGSTSGNVIDRLADE